MGGDETRAQAEAEAEDCIILLLLAAAARLSPTPTRRHLFGSPALVTEHLLPLFSYPLHPLSSFQTLSLPPSPDLALLYLSTGTEPPNRATSHRDPGSGNIRSNPVHPLTWPLKLSLFYTYTD
jgi:hypothetical protein